MVWVLEYGHVEFNEYVQEGIAGIFFDPVAAEEVGDSILAGLPGTITLVHGPYRLDTRE